MCRLKMFKIISLIFIFLFVPVIVNAACEDTGTDLYPESQSQTDLANISVSEVDDCIALANDGDTIHLPAGSVTWSSTVSWADKNISIIGAGIGSTVITSSAAWTFSVVDNVKADFRISGMTLTGNPTSGFIKLSSDNQPGGVGAQAAVYGWRLDHIRMDSDDNLPAAMHVYIIGLNWGVIDNCEYETTATTGEYFFNGIYSYVNYHDGYETSFGDLGALKGGYSWSLPIDWGTYKAVYIEDCTFNAPNLTGSGHPVDSAYGARIVFRHNSVVGGGLLMHPVSSDHPGTIKYEIYNNSFSGAAYTGWFAFQVQAGGTGVIFNNQWTNFGTYYNQNLSLRECRSTSGGCGGNCSSGSPLLYCDGGHTWDGNVEASGWPCFGQVGRSPGPLGAGNGDTPIWGESDPVYAWRNGADAACAEDSGTCTNVTNLVSDACPDDYVRSEVHSNGEVDFVNNGSTAKPGYTPYTYPHPLRDAAVPANAIQGVTIN